MAHQPPVFALIERLQVAIERAVMRFARRHRYATGETLRRQITQVADLANRAWRDRENAAHWTQELVWAVDALKHTMRVGKALQAFQSLGQFEDLARVTEDLGRQCGGWNRQQHRKDHPTGQNAAGQSAQPRRAKTLSTPAASPRGHA